MTLVEWFQPFSTQKHQFQLPVRHSSSTYQTDIADLINCQWNLFYQHVTITVMHSCCMKCCSLFLVSVSPINKFMQIYFRSLTLNLRVLTNHIFVINGWGNGLQRYQHQAISQIIFNCHQWDHKMLAHFFLFTCVMAITVTLTRFNELTIPTAPRIQWVNHANGSSTKILAITINNLGPDSI